MKKELLIFLPALHPELASGLLPLPAMNEIYFMSPGLEESADGYGGFKRYVSPDLVFNQMQAALCLKDLIQFQEEAGGDAASAARWIANDFWGALSQLESDELKLFVESGGSLKSTGSEQQRLRREIYEQAQKNLLLAWSQEKNVLDIRMLLNKLGQASEKLAETLGEPLPEEIEGGAGEYAGGAGRQADRAVEVEMTGPAENASAGSELAQADNSAFSGKPQRSGSIDGMVRLIMQESGLSPEDLQLQWPAALLGTLCLAPPETCYYTTRDYLEKLLAGIDEEERPRSEELSSPCLEALAEIGGRDWAGRLLQCRIPYTLLLSIYNSPLLKRLLQLDGERRSEVIFIFESNDPLLLHPDANVVQSEPGR